jgi:preprotein translocase subunit YajC
MSFLPMLAFIAILYFLLIRPQQKRQKQHKALISALKKGDKVVTSSGIIATVSKVPGDHEIVLEIAHGVHCKFVRSAIASVAQSDATAATASGGSSSTPVIEAKGKSLDTPVESITDVTSADGAVPVTIAKKGTEGTERRRRRRPMARSKSESGEKQ